MLEKYINKFILQAFLFGLLGCAVVIPLGFIFFENNTTIWIILGALYLFAVSYYTYKDLISDTQKECQQKIDSTIKETDIKIGEITQSLKVAEHKENLWRKLLTERASGFPSLFTNIAYYEQLIDESLSNYLRTKPHPAISSAETVKMEAKRRREAEYIQRKNQAIIEYYENIAPFLLDFKEQEIDDSDEMLKAYAAEEIEDPVTYFIAKEEYHKLPSEERNQLALDRFWKRPNKSKWLLGRLYERYVGYLYEVQGYGVDYVGVFKGKEDLGRDLICTKGNEVIIIQCKNWSQFKTIFEKHIFQFFGTVFQYRDENPKKKVRAIFYTTTELSDVARKFAKELKIELKEKLKLPNDYPCIKCNISSADNKSKIYHLPFDQQYDNTRIEVNRGEFYCATVAEAEKAGFRRAFKWHPTKGD